MDTGIIFQQIQPAAAIANYVESFWMLDNISQDEKQVVGLPDGRIDLFCLRSAEVPFRVLILGLNTHADHAVVAPRSRMFAVSFKLPAVEYILRFPISGLVNGMQILPDDFWGFNAGILDDFNTFCAACSQKIHSLLPEYTDDRKRNLFSLIYETRGEISVSDISKRVFWSARQINRYFNQQFGISLKTYCGILRFRASLEHIAHGKLFPELNFTDQNHFIKEVKKFSGTIPKDLFTNQNDRFILLSAIRQL